MVWFKRKEDPAAKLLDSFLEKMKEREFDVSVFDKKQIVQKYGHGLFSKLLGDLAFLQYKKLLFTCRVNEPRISWISNNYPDRIAINLAHSPGTLEFQKSLRASVKEMLELESIMNDPRALKV